MKSKSVLYRQGNRIARRVRFCFSLRNYSFEKLEERCLLAFDTLLPIAEMSKTSSIEDPANFYFKAIYDVGTEPATMAKHLDALLPRDHLETIGKSDGKSDPGDPFSAFQFSDNSRWSTTVTNGSGLTQGDPTTLRWGFVPDGTSISGFNGEATSPSNLISFMGSIYGVTTNDTIYTDEPWFPLFQSYINRWSQLSGLSPSRLGQPTREPNTRRTLPTGG